MPIGTPYTKADYRAVTERLADREKPMIVAGHNAFPGENRPAELQRRLFPLPESVRLHVYGHAHIGDERHVGENAYRTISYVDNHRIPQVDVASLKDPRGDTIRSAVLELYTDGAVACTSGLRSELAGSVRRLCALAGRTRVVRTMWSSASCQSNRSLSAVGRPL